MRGLGLGVVERGWGWEGVELGGIERGLNGMGLNWMGLGKWALAGVMGF